MKKYSNVDTAFRGSNATIREFINRLVESTEFSYAVQGANNSNGYILLGERPSQAEMTSGKFSQRVVGFIGKGYVHVYNSDFRKARNESTVQSLRILCAESFRGKK